MAAFLVIIKIAAIAFALIYFLLILVYIVNWEKIQQPARSAKRNRTFITVIVPARNEEKKIINCLQCLASQNYPADLFEVIVVNDFSTDDTQTITESFIVSHNSVQMRLINLFEMSEEKNGSKKRAIAEAVKCSKGELIITTDADCTMNTNWLKAFSDYYEVHEPYLISGPVTFEEKNLFDKIQSLEFISLIGIGAASIKAGYPLMCNGANLAFKKEIYVETGRTDIQNEPYSGDDTFLMFAVNRKYKNKIEFLKSADAIVFTSSQDLLKNFWEQRKRWASKIKSYSDNYVHCIGLFIFLYNIMIVATGILSLIYGGLGNIILLMILTKLIVEFVFLLRLTEFFNKKKLLWLLFPVEALHIFYIVFISLLTFSGNYEWKKRKIKM